MGLNLKNLLTKGADLFSTKENASPPKEFEVITEAMAERLSERAQKLIKGLDALQKNTKASQHHKIELQKWIDKENEELFHLKVNIRERKHSHMESTQESGRSLLGKRHPVWANDFNIYLDQIQDLFAVHKNECTIIQCNLGEDVLRSLRIFYYASEGNILCINSHRSLEYDCHTIPVSFSIEVSPDFLEGRPTGEYIFRPTPGGHAQWTFTGNRWGIDNNFVWLDFGKNKPED
jgi:hypothetical protein